MKRMEYKSAPTQIKDLDEKGRVVFYASVFNVKDHGKDIVRLGAFKKTIIENFANIRHYKHHESKIMPGVITELTEDYKGLLSVSDLIMDTTDGRETYSQYKAMLAAGKSMDHSIGYNTIKEKDGEDAEGYYREILEVKLFEVSTLTGWGMNPEALTVDVKGFNRMTMQELLTEERFYKELLNCEFTDMKLEQLELLQKNIQSLIKNRAGLTTRSGDEPTKKDGAGTTTPAIESINKLIII